MSEVYSCIESYQRINIPRSDLDHLNALISVGRSERAQKSERVRPSFSLFFSPFFSSGSHRSTHTHPPRNIRRSEVTPLSPSRLPLSCCSQRRDDSLCRARKIARHSSSFPFPTPRVFFSPHIFRVSPEKEQR